MGIQGRETSLARDRRTKGETYDVSADLPAGDLVVDDHDVFRKGVSLRGVD